MRHLLFLSFCLFTCVLYADSVSVEQAQALAANFFNVNAQTRSASPQIQLVWDGERVETRAAGTAPAFYVFNRTDSNGFVIVAGDDVALPILGYSYTNNFVVDGMPGNIRNWMNGLREQINAAREENSIASAVTVEAWQSAARKAVGTLEKKLNTANWDQGAPYNALCPLNGATRTVTGCVATALAILMKYYEWPEKGEGTLPAYEYEMMQGYLSVTKSIESRQLGHLYDWKKMPLSYKGGESAEAKSAVATLMYDCGVMSQAQFDTSANGGTGAITQVAIQGLINYMSYDKGARFLLREWYTDAEWNKIMKEEIAAGRLVLYGGANEEGAGHQFILDGYTDDDYFSVNWGWSGYCNGLYLLSGLKPEGQGIGGNVGGFTVGQDAVLGIGKAQTGSAYVETIVLMPGADSAGKGLFTTETDFQPRKRFVIAANYFFNMGFSNINAELVLSLMNKDGVFIEDISALMKLPDWKPGTGYGHNGILCEITTTINPGDRIWLRYKSSNSDGWQRVMGAGGAVSEIVLKVDPTSIEKTEKEETVSVFVEQDYVTVHTTESIDEIVLYDLDGRILEKKPIEKLASYSLALGGYPAGVYMLQVKTEKGIETRKFVKK